MKQIRRNVFETNSSSVHTLTICDANDYESWVSNKEGNKIFFKDERLTDVSEYYEIIDERNDIIVRTLNKEIMEKYDINESNYIDKFDEKYDEINKDLNLGYDVGVEDILEGFECETGITYKEYERIPGRTYYEDYINRYTTKSGDNVVCFGYFGHD